ncbi:MAG TPA: 5-amino-6-(D-ribitylamino)uracil--L-tyrosine 4-hydroxyphenyl transferase CofH [Candidatus Binataceae bacterium]|nr:5-amino-6-(D-ribitylamino)uracil--L-tyrosine 4-hydroxyphenyl transferase CofH [Candidatus Binataceae bacterium]
MNVAELSEYVNGIEAAALERMLAGATPAIRTILTQAMAGGEIDPEAGLALYTSQGNDLAALIKCADWARRADCGDEVTYVVNRNINFTNVCFVNCQFCGFKRHRLDSDAYDHSDATILAKVADAVARGATEICMQGGINPDMPAFKYRDLLDTIKGCFPQIHVHAFSPMEILYGARRARMNYREYIGMLREHGLGSIPGTAAEILDDEVREILSHKKVDVATWVEIITTAHDLGVPTTSTVMYGHLEQPRHLVNHLTLLRDIQKRTGGFTEFVPLRFVHTNTMLYRQGMVSPQPRGYDDLRLYAFARLYLRPWIVNLQTSWVKLGLELAALTLKTGCNDFSGTLMEESITAQAGGEEGEFVAVDEIEQLAARMGRVAVQRDTLYQKLRGKRAPNGARPIQFSSDHHDSCRGSGCG